MQTIIRYPNSHTVEALVLSIGRYAMRVVPRASDDTIELKLNYGRWTDESGVPIEFESFVLAADDDIRSMLERPQVCVAAIVDGTTYFKRAAVAWSGTGEEPFRL